MSFLYKKATLNDLEILVQTRIEVLRAANKITSRYRHDRSRKAVIRIL